MTPAPQILSNEIEDFQAGGGLYPGGTGIIKESKYILWDGNGKYPPNSLCYALIRTQPTDGSNDGKMVDSYYSVGSANDYVPDNTGGNVVSLRNKNFMDSTNWGVFLKKLRNDCGLEKGKLSTPTGIRVMENGIITLIRIEQPHREGMDELPKTGQKDDKKKFVATMLVPSKATFHWDPNYGNAMARSMSAAPAQGPAPATTQNPYVNGAPPAQATTQASAQTMSTAPITDLSLGGVLKSLLAKHGGSLSTVGLPKLVLEELIGANIDRVARVNIAKEAGDVNALSAVSQANGWVMAGTDIIG